MPKTRVYNPKVVLSAAVTVPRAIELDEIAAQMGISRHALLSKAIIVGVPILQAQAQADAAAHQQSQG